MRLVEFHQVGPIAGDSFAPVGPCGINPEDVGWVRPCNPENNRPTTRIHSKGGAYYAVWHVWGDYRDVSKRLSPEYIHSPE